MNEQIIQHSLGNSGISISALSSILILILLIFYLSYKILKFLQNQNDQINQEPNMPIQRRDPCCFCLNELIMPVAAQCSHSFCGKFFLSLIYFNNNQLHNQRRLSCPICRQPIILFFLNFDQNIDNLPQEINQQEIVREILHYNSQFGSSSRSIISMIKNAPYLFSRLLNHMSTLQGTRQILRICFTSQGFMSLMLLIISPYDLIPEQIFGLIGLIDDFFMIIIAFFILINLFVAVIARNDAQRYQQLNQ